MSTPPPASSSPASEPSESASETRVSEEQASDRRVSPEPESRSKESVVESSEGSAPAATSGPRAASPLQPLAQIDFVFGQNLADRVILPVAVTPDEADDGPEDESAADAEPVTTGSEDRVSGGSCPSPGVTGGEKNGTTIAPAIGAGAAAAKESSVLQKRKYEAIVTGEEDESNVLQIHCKLYHWETEESVWKERGKGFLKLNDKKTRDEKLASRLIMRTSGTLNVILNNSLVPGMNFSKSSDTSLKFTNFEGIFSVKAKEKDIELLHDAIECRMRELAKKVRSDGSHLLAPPVPTTPVTSQAPLMHQNQNEQSNSCNSSSPAPSSPSSSSNSSIHSSASPSASLSSDSVLKAATPTRTPDRVTKTLAENGPLVGEENGSKDPTGGENGLKPAVLRLDREADEAGS